MSFTYEGKDTNGPTTSAVSFSSSIPAATDLAILAIMQNENQLRTGSDPTINSQPMTEVSGSPIYHVTGSETACELWYLKSPPTGTQTIAYGNDASLEVVTHMAYFSAEGTPIERPDHEFSTYLTSTSVSVPYPGNIGPGGIVFNVCTGGYKDTPTSRTGNTIYEQDQGAWTTNTQYHIADWDAGTVSFVFNGSDEISFISGHFADMTDNDCSDAVSHWLLNNNGSGGISGTDENGNNTLTNISGCSLQTLDVQKGDGCLEATGGTAVMRILSGSQSSGFPFVSGGSNGQVTLCFWFKCSSVSATDKNVVHKGTLASNNFSFGVVINGNTLKWCVGYSNGSSMETLCTTGAILGTALWMHIAATYDASTKAWTFRVFDATNNTVDYNGSGTGTQDVDVQDDGDFILADSNSWTKYIDEVVVFNKILDSTDTDAIRDGIYAPTVTTHSLDGNPAATVTTTGALSVANELHGTAEATVTTTGNLGKTTNLAGESTATVTTTGDLAKLHTLAGTVTATVTTSGALSFDPPWLVETFEASEFDQSWYKVENGTATIDGDYPTSSVAGAPVSWGSLCCRMFTDGTSNAIIHEDIPSEVPDYFCKFELIVSEMSAGTRQIMQLTNISVAANNFILLLYNSSGTLRLQLVAYYDGSYHSFNSVTVLSLDTRYIVELKWDSTNDVWAWRINGVDQPNNVDSVDPITSEGTLSGSHTSDFQRIYTGISGAGGVPVWYLDNLYIGDGWQHYCEGSAAATVSTTGNLTKEHALAGVSTATVSTTGDLTKQPGLVGETATTVTTVGNLSIETTLAGSVSATVTSTGDLDVITELQGSVSATVTSEGDLTVTAGFTVLEGSVVVTVTTTGSLDAQPELAGSVLATVSTTGDLDVSTELQGSVSAAITTVGDLDVITGLQGSVSVTVTTTGTVEVIIGLQGESITTVTTEGDASVETTLAGTSATTVSTTGVLGVTKELQGSVSVVATITGSLDSQPGLVGNPTATVTTEGALTVPTAIYSRGQVLFSDESDEATLFSGQDYSDVSSDDGVRVDQAGDIVPAVFVFKDKFVTEGNISVTWNGQSSLAPSDVAVKLQIYNHTDLQWDDVDEENGVAADTDFNLSGDITIDLDKYFDENSWTTFRVYQAV